MSPFSFTIFRISFIAPVQVVESGEGRVRGRRVQGKEPQDVVGDGQGGGEAPAGGADRQGLHGRSLDFYCIALQ